MIRDEISVSIQTLRWKCMESRAYSKRLHYGRFALSPLRKGRADTIGIAMRRALLAEVEGTCITRVKLENIKHEYSAIIGIKESVHDILMNLKEIVLRSDSYGIREASIYIVGPRNVTAQDIILPPSVKIIDTTQHIARLTKSITSDIRLQIEKNSGYIIHSPNNYQDGIFPIDAVFMPVCDANYSIHSYGSGNEIREVLFLEIWTNGGLTPREALYEASRNLIDLFIPFLHGEEQNIDGINNTKGFSHMPPFPLSHVLTDTGETKEKIAFKHIFIDQLELPSRTYNCLRRANIHTLLDLLNYSREDLMRIEHFGKESVEQVLEVLRKRFAIDPPRN
uniref:DNA-directed RNA polymerase subunit alpha n=1 Tax=Tsuga chinensis TaxID=93694 RepID=A0A1Y0DEC7_9CONI|nr:RNA polymerase alpha subunit [Tsuga chinensis var. tchekiangensis]YP_010938332.1 RNA polymerase alpha subunit [Tsuga forrestii]ART87410.1 RpoA [Tsuga chinensis]UNP24346.1 RNA polymerase alpha subunit [Tsuga chinensis var. tchekiangensis]WLE64547.1 RNA polymerase alpha subunit [Tsuga forrestii]